MRKAYLGHRFIFSQSGSCCFTAILFPVICDGNIFSKYFLSQEMFFRNK